MIVAHSKAKSSSISAVITRADGTIEDLGMIAYWHRNPIKRWAVNVFIDFKERLRAW